MSEENKALARRFIKEAFNQGNLDVIDETISLKWVHHNPTMPEEGHGPQSARGSSSRCTAAPFPTST
jgi:predicted SnoaL-like aldol condensation-catalyzing enzyme